MDSAKIEELERLPKAAAKACPEGKWEARFSDFEDQWEIVVPHEDKNDCGAYPITGPCYQGRKGKQVARLIVALVNAAPELLAAWREREQYKAMLEAQHAGAECCRREGSTKDCPYHPMAKDGMRDSTLAGHWLRGFDLADSSPLTASGEREGGVKR